MPKQRKFSLKYREITELTKAELSSIIEEIFKPLEIKEISPTKDNKVLVIITSDWEYLDENNKKVSLIDEEEIILSDPFEDEGIELDSNTYDFNCSENLLKYKKFCLAKGVCTLLKDNPYL